MTDRSANEKSLRWGIAVFDRGSNRYRWSGRQETGGRNLESGAGRANTAGRFDRYPAG
ncbi:hypothetical protein V0288_03280 [Pannus brasiliensis CCIBt3594]|uniref:Uncharacterized protein n=1 Tax=Pannus brasiliensis CCIBt3594 TaxID=1427578 RepID=A0AAW9QGJ9_9CHRO